MPDGINDLVKRLSTSLSNTQKQKYAARLKPVIKYLTTAGEVRILIGNSQNFGHQSSSVNILRSLIGWGVPGPYTIALTAQDAGDYSDLEQKIRLLIPQYVTTGTAFQLDGATVTVERLTVALGRGAIALNGGFDDLEGKVPPWTNLNVANYLQLQPYAWHRGTNLVSQKTLGGDRSYVDLDTDYPKAQIKRRAFMLADPEVSDADWTAIAGTPWAGAAAIARYLLEQTAAGKINLAPVYGITTKGLPYASLYNYIAGLLAVSNTSPAAQRPIVVVVMSTVSTENQIRFNTYVRAPTTTMMALPQTPSPEFVAWHNANKVNTRYVDLWSADLQEVQTAVTQATPCQFLVLGLGTVPSIVFNRLYASATFPGLLEGQNTAELMLNLGRPYFKISSNREDTALGYPTLPLAWTTTGTQAQAAQHASFDGIVGALPDLWFTDRPTYPPYALRPVVNAFLGPKTDPLRKYFAGLREFFHEGVNDKLFNGLDLLVNIIKPIAANALVAIAAEPLAETPGALLEAFYGNLVAHTKDGELDLLVAVTDGMIPEFFSGVVTDSVFAITQANPQINADKTVVTLTGTTSAFGTGSASLDFTFTENADAIVTILAASLSSSRWAFPGAAWLSFGAPSLSITLDPNGAVPVSGTVGVTVSAGITADLTLTLPAAPDTLQLQASFEASQPGIASIFQMVGGINLQQVLPPQLQMFSELGIVDLSLTYDYTTNTMQSMAANIATPDGNTWQLVPAVSVTKLGFGVVIDSPGDVAARTTRYSLGGQFGLAGGTGYVNALVPQLRVSGGLTDDSPPVTAGAIVQAYLGTAFADALPASVGQAALTSLNFAVDQALGTYRFDVTVAGPWSVPSSAPIFSITQLGLAIAAVSRDINPARGAAGGSTTDITGTFSGALVILPQAPQPIGLTASAAYDSASKAWTFDARQTSGVVSLGALLAYYLGAGWQPAAGQEYGIDGLALQIVTAPDDTSWTFAGKTAGTWTVPFIDVTLAARLSAGDAGKQAEVPGKFGRVELDVAWQNIALTVWYDYNPAVQSYGLTWGLLQGTVTEDKATGDWTATLRFTENVTLGSMIEEMISWLTGSRFGLEAPWSVLDNIPLSGLALKYTFNKADASRNRVAFAVGVGPIELGFARIDSVDVGYQSSGANGGVNVALVGSFVWNTGANANGDTSTLGPWDASKPGAAPAPPGQGNKYFELRFLALGQHVSADCFASATTVQKAIECMQSALPPTEPGKLPAVRFDAASAWLIGADLGVLRLDSESKSGGNALSLAAPGLAALVEPDPWAPVLALQATPITEPHRVLPSGRTADQSAPGYFINLQVVFNDPRLYGLRLALDGAPAKIFKGLDFQIMYRQVSDTVGVYQAEITLPDVMRHLSVGVYSITLPVFGIAIYTNGDFQLDVGFPWNENFSRSFTIEGIIYPGIPVLGSAGFYFGKLSSATTDKVPRASNGTFNPVIVFGFGLQVGFGKSVNYGILSAGFSLTLFGIVEGVLGKWNPYALQPPGATNQLQGAYYFWLRGTVGILGKLYGTVDFAIVKADVNVTIKLMLQLTYESFVSITITVLASVDVSVSIKIDLGLFSISISFSFSMRVKESFTLKSDTTAPWITDASSRQSVLRARSALRTRAHRLPLQPRLSPATAPMTVNWSNLIALPAGSKLQLTGWLAPALTIARDEWQDMPTPDQQVACQIAMMFIDSVAPGSTQTQQSALKIAAVQAQQADTPFETLAKMVFRWVVAALQSAPQDAASIDALPVSDSLLQELLDRVLVSSDANPTPIPPQAATDFMAAQFQFTAKLPGTALGPDTTYFPIPGELKLSIPPYATSSQPGGPAYPGYQYTFGAYNQVAPAELARLRALFDDLAVQVESETQAQRNLRRQAAPSGAPLSMAQWMFGDYFLLLARQTVQAARDALRTFKYALAAGDTPQGIVDWANAKGALSGTDALSLLELFTANVTHPLNPSADRPLTIGVTWPLAADTSFAGLAAEVAGGITAAALAGANAADATLLTAATPIRWRDTGVIVYTVKPGDSLASVAAAIAPSRPHFSFEALLSTTDLLEAPGLLASARAPLVPLTTHVLLAGESFGAVAALPLYAGGFDATALAKHNAGQAVLRTGAQVKRSANDPNPYVVAPRNTLIDIALNFGLTLDQLLTQTAVLAQTDLLAPAAPLALPAFAYQPRSMAETLLSVASRFGVDVAVLADQTLNGNVPNLFAQTDATGAAAPFLDLPHLAQFPVGELLSEAQRSLALGHLSGMAARYSLHGMRVPADGIAPQANGMWVKGEPSAYKLPKQAGLFALTGQQFPLPDLSGQTAKLPIAFDRKAGPTWLVFQDAAGKTVDELVVTLDPASTDKGDQRSVARVLNLVKFARAGRVDITLSNIGAEAVVDSQLSTYPLTSQVNWQSTAALALPYGVPSGAAQQLRIWSVPDAMAVLPDPARRAFDPRFGVELARYDEGSGATVRSAPGPYGWATVVPLTVKRVPAVDGSPTSEDSYELVGADGAAIVLLERLLDQVQSDDSRIARLIVGYSAGQSGGSVQGIQTDDPAAVTLGIAQVNLSTVTQPPSSGRFVRTAMTDAESQGRLLNTPTAFLRLIWEASITRAGGFYLYYYDATTGRGLPDGVFNDKNETTLSVVVLWAAGDATRQNRLANYMTAVVTGVAIDTSSTVLFAEADPPTNPVATLQAGATDSMASLAFATYSDVGDLALANEDLALATTVRLTVSEGLTQAPPGGITLETLANQFATSVAALQSVNPGIANPVQYPAAVLLPRLTLQPGTSPGSVSLGAIASFYGQSLTALAAQNCDVAGLWTGSTVTLPGGPRVRTATVPPGVVAVAGTRAMPDPVPTDPSDPNYARLALLNAYSLLQPQLHANAWFGNSETGLAAGPVTVPGDPDNVDKIRLPKALRPGDDWSYRRALPFARFATQAGGDATGLPPSSASPYRGVGGVLQVSFDWLDYYGNGLVTTLSSPQSGDPQPWNDPPVRTGYTDALIGLGRWPSVSSSWQVEKAASGAQIVVALGFDPSRYQGLMTAAAPSATTITARFTDALEPSSASVPGNYTLTPSVALKSASLSSDGLTVTLTVDGLGQDGYDLSVQNLKLAATPERTVQGHAQFKGATVLSSSVQDSATRDLRIYTSLYYQLTDPAGIAYAIGSPLLAAGHAALPADQVSALLGWLFTGSAPVLGFLANRSAFGVDAPAPAAALPLTVPVSAVNPAEIFELSLNFEIARTGGAVAGDLETQPGIRSTSTRVAPRQAPLAGTISAGSSGTLGLSAFAAAYEGALTVPGRYRMTVASGTDRFQAGSASVASGSVWSVRIGLAPGEPVGYSVAQRFGKPDVFAPRPISNVLQSRTAVPIQRYTTGHGLGGDTTATDFSDIDVDIWGRTLFSAVDQLLSPRFTAAIQLTGQLWTTKTDFLQQLLGDYSEAQQHAGKKGGKQSLAKIASRWMIPVFAGESADPSIAKESYRQQLLARLSDAYATRAGVQFGADVWANVGGEIAPRLFGSIAPAGVSFESATVPQDSATTVTLDFTGALLAGPAADAANYSVTDGPGVRAATVSADGKAVTLEMTAGVTAGKTQVTVGVAVVAGDGGSLRPPRTRTVTIGAANLASTLGFTSSKLTLDTGAQTLSFLVSAPDVVRGASGEVISSASLDLAYTGTDIEHQIGALDGIVGYQASSWLTFVEPASRAPLRAELGAFEVPLVLRSFPASPSLPSQTGDASPVGNAAPLSQLAGWDYSFTYSLPFHYPQDRVHGLVEFNLRKPLAMRAGFEDAFAQMAQFVTAIPQVQADLDQYLASIDATTDPVKDADKVNNAAVALGAFVSMVDAIVQAADGDGLAMSEALPTLAGDPKLDYVFIVEERSLDMGATKDALLVTLNGPRPDGITSVSVEIEPQTYQAVPYVAADVQAGFSFVYLRKGTANQYLSAVDGQAIAERTVVLGGLDVLQRQDAWATIQVKRNEVLAGKAIAEPFVYATPKVKFAEPLFPTVSRAQTIALATLGSTDGKPVARPLDAHLSAFFAALLAQNVQPTLTFQVEVTYAYSLNPNLTPVQLPVIMQAPLQIQVIAPHDQASTSADTVQPLADMIDQWSQAITRWFAALSPSCGGTLTFDLTVMSDLTQQPMPLLRLSDLELPIQWVQNPLLACFAPTQ